MGGKRNGIQGKKSHTLFGLLEVCMAEVAT